MLRGWAALWMVVCVAGVRAARQVGFSCWRGVGRWEFLRAGRRLDSADLVVNHFEM
jgi:hypothetical protein